jgi:hypothetical protein
VIARSNRCRPATVSGLQGSDASTPRKSQKVCRCIPIQSPIGWLNHVKPLFCNTYIFIYIYNHRHIHIYIYIYTYIYNHLGTQKPVFFHRSGLTRFFCHCGFVGSIEGPIWRTQIRSVNAREVQKNLWVFIGCLSIFFVFSWRIVGLSASLGQLWPKVSQIDTFFLSNATYFQSRWNRHIPPVDDFFQSLQEKACEIGISTIKTRHY